MALKMNDSDTLRDFRTEVIRVVTQVRLLREQLQDRRNVEEVLMVPTQKV